MASRIANFADYSAELLHRLRRRAMVTGDEELERLYTELVTYPGVEPHRPHSDAPGGEIVPPLRLRRSSGGELIFLSTISTFGTAVDITLSELAIEAFYPADAPTATALLRDVT